MWLFMVSLRDFSQGGIVVKASNSREDVNTLHHELRTSLTIILGAVNFLNQEPLTSKQREYVAYISSSANTLLTVADALL